MIKHYAPKEIGIDRIVDFLTRASEEYPDEIGNVDLKDWPEKLNSFADAICFLDKSGAITAATFFYCNDLDNQKAYVTFFCSLRENPKGTAYQLHKQYIEYSLANGMKFSLLEVLKTNTHAKSFYERQGYSVVEDHGAKYLLQSKL